MTKGNEVEVRESPSKQPGQRRQVFVKELRPMMYGFGDDPDPRADSVVLVEDLLLGYLDTLLQDCQAVAATRQNPSQGPAKVKLEDILYCLRHDEKKTARVEEMLYQNENLKRARRILDFDEVGQFGEVDAD